MAISPYTPDAQLLTATADRQGDVVPALTRRVIKAATITNTTAGPLQVAIFLVPAGGATSGANCLISGRTIATGESYPCPELINQGIGPGGYVAAAGAGLSFKYTATDFV